MAPDRSSIKTPAGQETSVSTRGCTVKVDNFIIEAGLARVSAGRYG